MALEFNANGDILTVEVDLSLISNRHTEFCSVIRFMRYEYSNKKPICIMQEKLKLNCTNTEFKKVGATDLVM